MALLVPKPIGELSEKEWELQAIGTERAPGLARTLGYVGYHTLRSKGSQPGWPDWALVRERMVMLELKTEAGAPSPAQREWIRRLLAAGVEVYIARPRHFDLLARILAHRGDPYMARGEARDAAVKLRAETVALITKGATA